MLQGIIALGACWALAVMFYRVWQTPLEVEGGAWVRYGFAILGLELVLNLAGVFLTHVADPDTELILNGVALRGTRQQQVRRRALVVFYVAFTLLGAGIALAVGSRGLLLSFLGLMVSRALGLWLNPVSVNHEQTSRYGVNLAMLFVLMLLTVFIPFSSGGLTPEVLAQVYPNRGSGIWAEHPERVLVLGMIYFSCLGLVELTMALRTKSSAGHAGFNRIDAKKCS